jgi:hypothetical protein
MSFGYSAGARELSLNSSGDLIVRGVLWAGASANFQGGMSTGNFNNFAGASNGGLMIQAPTIQVTSVSTTGTAVTLNFSASLPAIPVGTIFNVSNMVPTGYNGQYTVTSSSAFGTSITYASTTTGTVTTLGQICAAGAYMSFHRPMAWAAYFGIDTDNKWKVGGWSMGAVSYEILHMGNLSGITATITSTISGNGGAITATNSYASNAASGIVATGYTGINGTSNNASGVGGNFTGSGAGLALKSNGPALFNGDTTHGNLVSTGTAANTYSISRNGYKVESITVTTNVNTVITTGMLVDKHGGVVRITWYAGGTTPPVAFNNTNSTSAHLTRGGNNGANGAFRFAYGAWQGGGALNQGVTLYASPTIITVYSGISVSGYLTFGASVAGVYCVEYLED